MSAVWVIFVLGCAWAAINFIRGRKLWIKKYQHVWPPIAWALTGGAAALALGYSFENIFRLMITLAAGTAFWLVWGWGLYFSAFHGIWKQDEKEIGWIDWLGKKLVPWQAMTDYRRNRRRGTICMALRGLYIAPMFAVLAWQMGHPAWGWLGLIGLAQGAAYGVMRHLSDVSQGAKWAEPLIMFIFGVSTGFLLWAGA